MPVRDSVVAFEALLVKPSVPEAVPEACGAKAIVIGTLCPAAIVSGKIIPLRENSGLFKLAEDTVTLAPVALSFPAREVLVPTVTLPKFAELGETDN